MNEFVRCEVDGERDIDRAKMGNGAMTKNVRMRSALKNGINTSIST